MKLALAAFRSKPFRLLFAGELVSLLGTAVAPIALAFAVLDLTGSATDLGYVLAAGWAPQIVFILIGGVLGDRLPRNLVMVGANLLSAAAQGTTAALLLAASPSRGTSPFSQPFAGRRPPSSFPPRRPSCPRSSRPSCCSRPTH